MLGLQLECMSTPDKLKRQPTANTTSQSTPSFDAIDPDKEMSQRTDEAEEEITEAVEEKREGRQKSSGGRNPSASQK